MMNALWSGVSGLKNHQTKMDVIGNNIANVNTVGFKSSRVTFQDMLSDTMQSAGSPSGNIGGVNPLQVGMGMSVASIDTIFTDGAPQATGKQTDLAISGQGFFQVSNDGGVTKKYTRDGAFDFDTNGDYIVPSTGYKVMGYQVDSAGNPTGSLAAVNIPKTDTMPAKASTKMIFNGNLLASATVAVPATSAALNAARSASAAASGAAAITVPAPATAASVAAAVAASVGVTPAETAVATAAAAAPGSSAASVAKAMAAHLTKAKDAASASSDVPTTFKVFDSLGTGYDLNGTMEKIGPNTWTFTPVGTIVDPATGATIAKVSTTPANSSVTINFNPATGTFSSSSMGAGGAAAAGKGAAPAPAASGAKGAASSSPAGSGFSITITPTGSPTSFTVNPDFSAMTQYDSPSTAAPFRTDGYPAGSLAKLTVSSTGMFVAAYTNGQTANKAQVALFNFNNPGGLEKAGGNMYLESNNSGVARKDEVSSVNSGSLEMSNVDLAAQFSDMIVTQRGFQANSKTITTVDTMLEELVNLKR